ncbi:MAG: helix-turn-helix domain-containing protein [Bacteroidales bacterium]|nr:helix-turn-helix domain-containing protein [Bacteroidales bacterium]
MNQIKENNVSYYVSKFINGTNQSVFLTGKAGTGKTTLLKQIVATTHKKTVVAAPTGIAAINAGGVTLHSLFHLPFGSFIPDNVIPAAGELSFQLTTPKTLIRNLKMNSHKKALIREMELLIIDEVSMLRADLLDAIDNILRYVRRNNSPFGGLQILFIGDLWQLPPVVKNEEWSILKNYYSNIFFFNATPFKQVDLIHLELEEIYRQTDPEFIVLLNNFRLNKINQTDIDIINKQYKPQFNLLENEGYIYLTTHNHKADKINKQALEKLPSKSYRFEADITDEFSEYAFPIDITLELKEGAQVMFIKNDYSGNQAYYNGKIGKIESVSDDNIKVSFPDGTPSAVVEQYTWENKKFALNQDTKEIEERIVGTFVQYPIKLAWAVTIHKSQGLTFEKAMIDISQAFAAGQTYVALSRLTSLKGLVLASPVRWSGPETDKALSSFAQSKISVNDANKKYSTASKQYVNNRVSGAFNFNGLITALREHIGTYDKDAKKSSKQKYLGWAQNQLKNTQAIVDISGKFQNQIKSIIKSDEENCLIRLKERLTAAKDYFIPLLKEKQDEIETHINLARKEKGIKTYLKELKELQGIFYGQIITIYKAEALCMAILNNEELNKETLHSITGTIKKPSEENKIKSEPARPAGGKKKKEKAKLKIKTAQITYELYKQGKTIEEIVEERSLNIRTIEGHISDCIAQGKIKVSELIVQERIDEITNAATELDTLFLKPIKEHLGDDFSYPEIKFVMSWMKYKNTIEK